MKKVSVIGAGFAGLTISLRLAQKGFAVDLYEKRSQVGGLLGTDKTEFGISERAANALIRSQRSEDLFHELEIPKSYPLASSKKRFIFREGPSKWPLNFFETLGFALRLGPKIIFAKSSLRPRDNETLENWGYRHLGPCGTRYLLGPAMQGIYGNEISGLSAKLILSGLFSKKREKYKGLLTGPGGMQDLVNHLEKRLIDLGVKIHTNCNIDLNKIEGPLVVATSASAASFLLQERAPKISDILKTIRMSSLMSTTLFFKNGQERYKGFGCLIPRGLHIKTLGILMNSYIFEDRNKTYNETWIIGGAKEESLLNLTDEQLLKLITEERFKILGQKDEVSDYRINRWPHALPYYDLNLEKAQKDLSEVTSPTNIYLHGNYLSGIGLSKILERSEALAEEINHKHG